MERVERAAPLPDEMQGRWIDAEDPSSELHIVGGEITCFGQVVNYDYKLIGREDGALTVSLEIEDMTKEDEFERANITGLVVTPEGEFLAYNVKFGCQFVRADD